VLRVTAPTTQTHWRSDSMLFVLRPYRANTNFFSAVLLQLASLRGMPPPRRWYIVFVYGDAGDFARAAF
jgi:hypothetical protein